MTTTVHPARIRNNLTELIRLKQFNRIENNSKFFLSLKKNQETTLSNKGNFSDSIVLFAHKIHLFLAFCTVNDSFLADKATATLD